MIINNEKIKYAVRKAINEAMSDDFSFDTLKNINTFKGRLEYCKKNLGPHIGKGSSRICFQLDDNTILKLAINYKGIAQNEVEARFDAFLDNLNIRPEIYDETDYDDYLFIVCEYVLPARKSDFYNVMGITWDEYLYFIDSCGDEKRGREPRIGRVGIENKISKYPKLNNIREYIMMYSIPVGDLMRIANYGLTKNNGIVILDTGLDDYVFRHYYFKHY